MDRTPRDFSFHFKTYALMTGQPTEVARLPDALVDAMPPALAGRARVYAKDLPAELLDAVWNHYLDALTPLHEASKLGESSVPAVAAVTTPSLAMMRLHGRRSATWRAANVSTVERYRYLYTPTVLDAAMPLIESAAAEATRTIVFFNNCYGNYGATNAREMVARLALR